MTNKVNPVPAGFHTVTPYLMVNDGQRALAFYQQAFGAVVNNVEAMPDGKILNAEFRIGDSNLMMGEHEADAPEAGLLAALSARENKRAPLFLGFLLLAFSLLKAVMSWSYVPLWYHVVFTALLLPMAIMGGKLKTTSIEESRM